MRRLTRSFETTYSEALHHTGEAIKTEIEEREKKIQALVEMIDDLEARIKDQNIVLASNTSNGHSVTLATRKEPIRNLRTNAKL